MKIDIQSAVY